MGIPKLTKPKLTETSKKILEFLLNHGTYATTTQVAKEVGLSWNTALAYLNEMYYRSWIQREKQGNRKLWKAERQEKE